MNDSSHGCTDSRPQVTVLYHFFHPDDVVSARHFSDLAEGLAERGWDVHVLTSNRYCRYPERRIEQRDEVWNGVSVHRIRRPGLDQSRNLPRLLNLAWMVGGYTRRMLTGRRGLYIVGTDPQFSQLMFPIIKRISRHNRVVLWSFDLYPEAIAADDPEQMRARIARRMTPLMKRLYRHTDVIVDIGACMRRRLDVYEHRAERATLTPWALVEPPEIQEPDPEVRKQLFGDARLGLFYSGNMGRAHRFRPFLDLARRVRQLDPGIAFSFACRGARADELKAALRSDDDNVSLAPFARLSELAARLSSADIHLLSLRPEWTGIVVPSKFFGSLAVGRPVLYVGPPDSAVGTWIDQFDVGITLEEGNVEQVAQRLVELAADPARVQAWQRNAFDAYHAHFSCKAVIDGWDAVLREQLQRC